MLSDLCHASSPKRREVEAALDQAREIRCMPPWREPEVPCPPPSSPLLWPQGDGLVPSWPQAPPEVRHSVAICSRCSLGVRVSEAQSSPLLEPLTTSASPTPAGQLTRRQFEQQQPQHQQQQQWQQPPSVCAYPGSRCFQMPVLRPHGQPDHALRQPRVGLPRWSDTMLDRASSPCLYQPVSLSAPKPNSRHRSSSPPRQLAASGYKAYGPGATCAAPFCKVRSPRSSHTRVPSPRWPH